MKRLLIACLMLGTGILQAQNSPDLQNATLEHRINRVALMQKEWKRGHAQGVSDRQAGRGYYDRDPLAVSKNIPTSEAYQSGYHEGYWQKR